MQQHQSYRWWLQCSHALPHSYLYWHQWCLLQRWIAVSDWNIDDDPAEWSMLQPSLSSCWNVSLRLFVSWLRPCRFSHREQRFHQLAMHAWLHHDWNSSYSMHIWVLGSSCHSRKLYSWYTFALCYRFYCNWICDCWGWNRQRWHRYSFLRFWLHHLWHSECHLLEFCVEWCKRW